jgi:hypothetical protein
MPPREVYSVDFRNGNMNPVSSMSWGELVSSESSNSPTESPPTAQGLILRAARRQGDGPVSHSLYVLPPEGAVPFQSRLRMRVWFAEPYARPWPATPLPPKRPEPTPENWAVGLKLKLGGAVESDPFIAVTCQFSRRGASGIRVNGFGEDQADPAAYLDSPLDYQRYRAGCFGFGRAPEFMLEFNYCGMQAGPISDPPADPPQLGYAVGCASLSIADRSDHRPFSNRTLSTGSHEWIGALGVSVATLHGVGQYQVVLRRFSVDLW